MSHRGSRASSACASKLSASGKTSRPAAGVPISSVPISSVPTSGLRRRRAPSRRGLKAGRAHPIAPRPDTRPSTQTTQPQRPEERPTGSDTARPDTRPSTQTTQPQRPEERPTGSDTARPGASPAPDGTQRQGATTQRPDATQPGATTAAPTGSAPAGRQSAAGEQAEPEKRRIADTVRERVERNEIRPVENLGVSVSVGAELPSRVQLQPLPSEIASIRPQYRDYRYTVSEREIVIVDPRSRRIVEVIERGGGRSGGSDIYAVFEQRRDLRRWNRPSSVVFEQGVVLPSDAPYYDLPVEIVERNPRWRGHQYVMTERDEVAIVEPRTRRVVEVVDRAPPSRLPPAGTILPRPEAQDASRWPATGMRSYGSSCRTPDRARSTASKA